MKYFDESGMELAEDDIDYWVPGEYGWEQVQ